MKNTLAEKPSATSFFVESLMYTTAAGVIDVGRQGLKVPETTTHIRVASLFCKAVTPMITARTLYSGWEQQYPLGKQSALYMKAKRLNKAIP